MVTAVETDPVVVAIVPETAPSLVAVDAEVEDDDLGVQVEPDADEGTAAVDAAAPAIPVAPAPAPVAMAVATVEPALEEARDPGARPVPDAGGEGRAEPGVRMEADAGGEVEADAGGEVAEEGAVAAYVEAVVEVPSGDDALALLEERAIRLENVEIEGALGNQPTPEQIFAQLCDDERSATTVKGKRRVQLKRLGADPDMLSNRLTPEALRDIAEIEAFLANPENVKAFENRISVARRLGFNPKTEVALNLYFREIFHALVCGKIALDVVLSLMETLIDAFAFLSRKVRPGPAQRANKAAINTFHTHLAQRKTASLLTEYKAIMEAESQRQRDCHARRTSSNVEPPTQRVMSRRLAAKTAHTSNGLSKAVAILTSDGTAPGDLETFDKIVAKTPTDATVTKIEKCHRETEEFGSRRY